ncbi:MAG: peptidase dimerization domain-containing protein [Opitutales bacterium]
MNEAIEPILKDLPRYREDLQGIREILLANAVMAGEIPSPTFEEEKRVRFLLDRFTECGCQTISTDEAGNAVSIWPGSKGEGNILVLAHVDTPFARSVDHSVSVQTDRLEGPGIGDNAVGVAAIASLPIVLEKLGIQLQNNLILLGSTKGLGQGDLGGLRFFLENNQLPLGGAVCIEGVELGRLSFGSLGMLRAEIECVVPRAYDWTRFGAAGAIAALNRVIQGLQAIPLSRDPAAEILLGSISGGTSYNTVARKAVLRFEVRAEEAGMISSILEQIEEVVEEVGQRHALEVRLNIVARRKFAGLPYDHSLVRGVRQVMKTLEIDARIYPSVGELSVLLEKDIPSVTVGLTQGENIHEFNESIRIEPLYSGLTQLLGVLRLLDDGVADPTLSTPDAATESAVSAG